MSDSAPLMNEPEARTETGEIKPQNLTASEGEQNTNTTPATTSTETKPADQTKTGEAKAPDAYEPFKLPEGIELKGEELTKATTLFKELNLDQAAAQKLVDFHAAQIKALASAPDTAFDELTNEWKTKAEADPEIGPFDGAKALALKTTIAKGLDALGDPALAKDFKSVMNLTGAGNNPAFIKAFAKFAERFIEGKPTNMSSAKPAEPGQRAPDAPAKSIASAMYPNLPA